MGSGEENTTGEVAFGFPLTAKRAALGGPVVLAKIGALEVRLAATAAEIRAVQKLRYRVFFREGGALAAPIAARIQRDICRFDRVCDHLIVVDNAAKGSEGVTAAVGAYRLLRQPAAEAHFGFYSARQFQVGALIARHPGKRFLELGRSCVAENYRGRRALELLWRGIWVYALTHRIDVMFGCASFFGTDASAHAPALRFLHGEDGAAPEWSVDAIGAVSATETPPLDSRAALRVLPPLIKGYWRLGAKFSRHVVSDPIFGTTDILAVLPIEAIRSRYLEHFAPREKTGPLAA